MSLFRLALDAHIAIGTVVLASFWTAALAAKGSLLHRRGGRLYVGAMGLLLAVTLAMTAGMALEGDPRRAMFNVYVSLISVVSVWMAWSSIAWRHDIRRYTGWPYRVLFALLACYGLFVLTLAPRMPQPARAAMVAAFGVLGLSIAAAMAWRLWKRDDSPRWWLAEHLTAMGINFAATHASFSILAGGSVFPLLKDPWVRTGMLCAWMGSALCVRLWAGRRFLASPARFSPPPPSPSAGGLRGPGQALANASRTAWGRPAVPCQRHSSSTASVSTTTAKTLASGPKLPPLSQ